MASEAYERILTVQSLDLDLRRLRHRRLTHPARATIDELDGRAAALGEERAVVEERRHELERTRKRQEDEAATTEAKRSSLDAKLYGGEVTATKELLAIQDEMAALAERQRGIEDAELEVMEQLEELDAELADFDRRRSLIDGERSEASATLDQAVAEIDAEIETVTEQRRAAAEPANPDLLAHYEGLIDQFDGMPLARLANGACDGCNIQLSAMAADRLAKLADDAVVTCEECGRLLVR